MGRYVVERTLPGAGTLSEQELRDVSVKSNEVLAGMGEDVHWVESYVTDDKLYCVYDAADPDLIEEHAKRGGFPCDRVAPVRAVIDPGTGS
ncbi:DUF4242 domain-containing protein [Prauserella alba]|uniref:DUF4242 domain-containing protein n=1 Tax=Prauserella alba TaxID=176898 RepID=A0ABN1VGC6_9PSEU|nr:DUF4242 domain-containing protein [Prauserella alba]MCP2182934.1 Protein of unknown function (DUF4242) [Prauserella alba]